MFSMLFKRKNKVPRGYRGNPKQPSELQDLSVTTATATLVIYDLAALQHRKHEDIDWWTDAPPELEELQRRNLLILGLGSDGCYVVTLVEAAPKDQAAFSLNFPSGEVFIGPGEELTGGDHEPTGAHGGCFISVQPGDYRVSASRNEDRIEISLSKAAPFKNNQKKPVVI